MHSVTIKLQTSSISERRFQIGEKVGEKKTKKEKVSIFQLMLLLIETGSCLSLTNQYKGNGLFTSKMRKCPPDYICISNVLPYLADLMNLSEMNFFFLFNVSKNTKHWNYGHHGTIHLFVLVILFILSHQDRCPEPQNSFSDCIYFYFMHIVFDINH